MNTNSTDISDYLGIDHVGHKFGPSSSLIPSKLREMNDVIRKIHETLQEQNKDSAKKSVLFVTTDHGMRDEGGHSGNSYAETHIPLLILGCECESNREIFYQQIDFAPTFSIVNGLPIPRSAIGSIIPEMLFNTSQIEKLDILEKSNERLLKLIKSKSDEFKHEYDKARTFHQIFKDDVKNQNAFHQAETNYLQSSRMISDELGRRSLEMNSFQVFLGLIAHIFIVLTLLVPNEEDSGKDCKFSIKSFVYLFVGSLVIKTILINEIFAEKNDMKSLVTFAIMLFVLRIVFGVFICKIDRMKKVSLFDHDLIYILLIGHLVYSASVASSSFVEEEHQIWYYFCNSMLLFFSFIELRRDRLKNFARKFFMFIGTILLHIVIRRINQTGDKWIKIPDISDWLHHQDNIQYLNASIALSLFATFVWLTKNHGTGVIKRILMAFVHILLYFHQTSSIEIR